RATTSGVSPSPTRPRTPDTLTIRSDGISNAINALLRLFVHWSAGPAGPTPLDACEPPVAGPASYGGQHLHQQRLDRGRAVRVHPVTACDPVDERPRLLRRDPFDPLQHLTAEQPRLLRLDQ